MSQVSHCHAIFLCYLVGQLTDFRATLGPTFALWVAYGFFSVCIVQSLNWVEIAPITGYCRIGSKLGTHPSLQCNAAFNPLRNKQPLGKIAKVQFALFMLGMDISFINVVSLLIEQR